MIARVSGFVLLISASILSPIFMMFIPNLRWQLGLKSYEMTFVLIGAAILATCLIYFTNWLLDQVYKPVNMWY